MRIAISVADGRVSPVFDVAGRLVLVDVEEGQEMRRDEARVQESELGRRARRVAELCVNVLICGAISRPLEMMLASAGVEVIPHICGDAERVLRAFLAGTLSEQAFVMPGCCGRRRRFHGGRAAARNEGKEAEW